MVEGMREEVVLLPHLQRLSMLSLEEALLLRRSTRSFTGEPVKLRQLAMILWAANGITDRLERRTVPSAGATYPLNLYAVVGEGGVVKENGDRLPAGIYLYDALKHSLLLKIPGDLRSELQKAALKQIWVGQAPVSLVITAVYSKVAEIYGERGRTRYVPMEAGHAGQNIYLMATALGLGTVAIGAFDDEDVSRVLSLRPEETPLYIMPVGVPRRSESVSFAELNSFFESKRIRA